MLKFTQLRKKTKNSFSVFSCKINDNNWKLNQCI